MVTAASTDPSSDLADSYRATAPNNPARHFLVNKADEVEKAAASAGFYGGFAVEESPNPYHAPVIDQVSGFGDIRDGAEAFPEQWQDNERRTRAYTVEEAAAVVEEYPMDTTSVSTRPVLVPASRKIAAAQSRHDHGTSPMVIDLTGDESSQDESDGTG